MRVYRHDDGASGWELVFDDARFHMVLSPSPSRGFSGEGQALLALAAADGGTATARVRIFTPTFEMPFAGHPTLGTAHVVRALKGGDDVTLEMREKATAEGLNSFCDLPLISRNRLLGMLAVARRDENAFGPGEVAFLSQVANQVAIGVENALAYREIADLKDRLAQEKLYLESEIRNGRDVEGFEGIVGESPTLRHVQK